MAKKDKYPNIKIDNNVATWNINMQGLTGGTYLGTFTFRTCLTPLQKIAAGREYRDLLGPHATLASEHEGFMCYGLTQLKYRIITAPPFWYSGDSEYGGNLLDENVISAVLNAAIDSELKYKLLLEQRQKDAIKKARSAVEQIRNSNDKDDEDSEESDEA